MPSAVNTVTPGILRAASATFSSTSAVTNKALDSILRSERTCTKSLVLGAANVNASNTTNSVSATFADNTDLRAKRRTF